MLPKSFVIIFITYVYTMYIPTMGSQRQHVFRVYVIGSNCAWLHNFFFLMIDYGENGYLHSKMWEKNDRKLIIGGVGVNVSWVEKIEESAIGGGGRWGLTIIRDMRVCTQKIFFFTILMGTKKNFYPQKTNTRKPCLHTIINWTKNDHELIVYNIII